jgi:hypothetical protein
MEMENASNGEGEKENEKRFGVMSSELGDKKILRTPNWALQAIHSAFLWSSIKILFEKKRKL